MGDQIQAVTHKRIAAMAAQLDRLSFAVLLLQEAEASNEPHAVRTALANRGIQTVEQIEFALSSIRVALQQRVAPGPFNAASSQVTQ